MIGMVILNFNDYSTVIHLYKIVKEYKCIDQIVIVDNCSTDNSYEKLKTDCDCVVIKSEKNGGYAYGNNYGIKWLENNMPCDYYIVSNPDVEFDENFVNEITLEMGRDKSIGIMSGVMYDRNNKPVMTQFGYTTSYWKAIIECFYLYRYYQMHYARNQVDKKRKINIVEVVWGSLFMISAQAYKDIQGFDENTFLYHEENIISERMRKCGYKEAILSNIKYIHMHAVTISKATSRMNRHIMGMKSQYYFQCKYHNLNNFKQNLLKIMIKYSIVELKIINNILAIFGK